MYKITFQLKSAVSFVDLPTFDGILAWCYMKEKYGIVEQKLSIPDSELENFEDMPIVRHPDGYFLASWMFFDKSKAAEFTGSWKKRWANQHDDLVDFGKKVEKVPINKGAFKSYDTQIVLQQIKEVWFFFASSDVDRVRALVSKHLWGLGKKTSQGYGEISGFQIEAINYDPFLSEIIRPIPIAEPDLQTLKSGLRMRLMGFRPPYWLPQNQAFCLLPNDTAHENT